MKVADQLKIINEIPEQIMEAVVAVYSLDSYGNQRRFEVKEIPLNKTKFYKFLATINMYKAANVIKSTLEDVVCDLEDGEITIINTSGGSINSFIIDTRYYNMDSTYKPEVKTDNTKFKVTCSDTSGKMFIRTLSAKSTEKAINDAVYSLNYDRKQNHTFVRIEEVH